MSSAEARGKVLGLSGGQPDGSAEILLKAALRAAAEAGAEVELVRLGELRLDYADPGLGEEDDGEWLFERLLACDGLIVSTPIITRSVAPVVKVAIDRLLGPNADAAFVEAIVAARREGRDPVVPMRADERVLRPRVAGLIAVGGSLTDNWKSLALPTLHSFAFSMHIAVADQVVFAGAGSPKSIVLDADGPARAAAVGLAVGEQLGVAFEEVEYRGAPGLCPMCHLNALEVRGRQVECVTCGARGELAAEPSLTWTDLTTSVISMEEKRNHFAEVLQTAKAHGSRREEIEAAAAPYADWDPSVSPNASTS
ncbi:MAG: flavodoxin family protein [Verrucomicrobia bacterium]|nr:flavodoxin family protein [Verrucomicrobiota bacterium]